MKIEQTIETLLHIEVRLYIEANGTPLLRVGVHGLRRMGKLHFLNALHMRDVKVGGITDQSRMNRRLLQDIMLKTYENYAKLLDSEESDAVLISLLNFLKKEGVFSASEKGLDIFVDKPPARNLAEVREGERLRGSLSCLGADRCRE